MEILHIICLLPIYYENLTFYYFKILTFFALSFALSVCCQMTIMSHLHTEYPCKTSSQTLDHNTHILKYTLSSPSLTWAEVDSHMTLLNFSHSSRKCIWLTYLKIAMCKPSHTHGNQVLLCSFEHLYLCIQVNIYHCWGILEDIPAIEK